MSVDANALVLPGKYTVFSADVGTAPPADITAIDPNTSTTYTGWDCWGHTSRDNTVALTKDGGDATSVGTALNDAVRTSYAPVSLGATINALQMDYTTLSLAFPGGVVETGGYTVKSIGSVSKALLLLLIDGSVNSGWLIYNASCTLGDAPTIPIGSFVEVQIATSWNVDANGNLFHIYGPETITAPA